MSAEQISQTLNRCAKVSPSEGAAEINALYSSKEDDGDTFLWKFWGAVITTAAGLAPDSQDMNGLINLLSELVQTDVDTIDDQRVWSSRRGLSLALRENVDGMFNILTSNA